MDKLKKCPFCGGEAEFATSHKRWVQCKECLAESVYCDTPEQAIAAWNNRKPVEDVLERQTLKSQIDDDLESHISELKQAKFDIETFWEEPTALSKALQDAIRALMEIQQYRQIGNLEEIRLKLGAFDQIKWERDIAIAQLTDIGCSLGEKMDDVVAAVERQKPRLLQAKKAYNKGYMINAYHCPTCNEQICFEGERRSTTISNTYKYCKKCGQAIDWREE